MKKNNNRKGFTLVELLAVIVILAILMVAAGAAVMSTMNNAKVNNFKNEALTAIDTAELLYSDLSMDPSYEGNNIIVKSADNNYKGICVTLRGLVENGYLEKNLNNDLIRGVVLVEQSIGGGTTKYSIWMTDGTYGIPGYEKNKISSLRSKDGNNTSKTGIVTDTTNLIDEKIKAAYGTTGTGSSFTPKKDESGIYVSTNVVTTLASPATTTYGGTGTSYTNIKCINGRLG